MRSESIDWAAGEIRRYLTANPHAADALDGIHHYWINWPGQMPEAKIVTQTALERLEQERLVVKVRIGDMTLWKLARADSSAI